jgi:hypothetical protein
MSGVKDRKVNLRCTPLDVRPSSNQHLESRGRRHGRGAADVLYVIVGSSDHRSGDIKRAAGSGMYQDRGEECRMRK